MSVFGTRTEQKPAQVFERVFDRIKAFGAPLTDSGINPDTMYAHTAFLKEFGRAIKGKHALVVMGPLNYEAVQKSEDASKTWMKWARDGKAAIFFNASAKPGQGAVTVEGDSVLVHSADISGNAISQGDEKGNIQKTDGFSKAANGGIRIATFYAPLEELTRISSEMAQVKAGEMDMSTQLGFFNELRVMRLAAESAGDGRKISGMLSMNSYEAVNGDPEARAFWGGLVKAGKAKIYVNPKTSKSWITDGETAMYTWGRQMPADDFFNKGVGFYTTKDGIMPGILMQGFERDAKANGGLLGNFDRPAAELPAKKIDA